MARWPKPKEGSWTEHYPELGTEPVSYEDSISPEFYELEREAIFKRAWLNVGRVEQLPRKGSYFTKELAVAKTSLVIVRDMEGKVRAFHNICRHRGAKLCVEETGTVKRNFQCPYHAWTYGLDGKLVAAPNLTSMPDIDRVEYGLKKVHLREWLGYAWLSLADEPASFEETVQQDVRERLGNLDAIGNYQVSELELGRRITYDVKANWKLIIENFMECYHCATIHPELTEVLPEFADGYAAQYYVGHGAVFGEEIKGFTIDGSEGFDTLDGVGSDQERRYYAITVRPQVFINLVPDHVIIHRMFPMAADRTIDPHTLTPDAWKRDRDAKAAAAAARAAAADEAIAPDHSPTDPIA